MILFQVKLEGKYIGEVVAERKEEVDMEEETKAEMTAGGPAYRGLVLTIDCHECPAATPFDSCCSFGFGFGFPTFSIDLLWYLAAVRA